jgi:hypothetical protein
MIDVENDLKAWNCLLKVVADRAAIVNHAHPWRGYAQYFASFV